MAVMAVMAVTVVTVQEGPTENFSHMHQPYYGINQPCSNLKMVVSEVQLAAHDIIIDGFFHLWLCL